MVRMEQTLYDAAMSKAKEVLPQKLHKDILVDLGMSYLNASPLHLAASHGDLEFVKRAICQIPQLAEASDSRSQTPLHLASAEGHIDIVKELVSANVDVCTYQDLHGRNPLHVAVAKGHIDIVKELVSADVDMFTSRDLDGKNPLHVAVMKGHVDIVKELVSANVDMCISCDLGGRNPLHVAVIKGNVDIVKELVKSENIDDMCTSRDLGGRNPLHVALVKDKVGVLEVLVQACPIAAQDRADRDQTILHLGVKHNRLQALELLLRNPKLQELANAKDADGNTVLHLAVRDANFEMVKVIARGRMVIINVENTDGFTALDMLPKSEPESVAGNNTSSTFLREEKKRIRKFIRQRGWSRGKLMGMEEWLTRKKESIMVVAALIATVAFQAGMTPPGGTWQDNSDGHIPGESILADTFPEAYKSFIFSNAVAFGGSLSTILLIAHDYRKTSFTFLLLQVTTLSIAVTSMAFTYLNSVTVMTPDQNMRSAGLDAIKSAITVLTLVLVSIGFAIASFGIVKVKIRKCTARWRMNHRPESV